MRLIDDTATKIDVWGLFNDTYNDASRFTEEETEFAKRILSDVQEVIENQPTAFDLESVISKFDEYKRQQSHNEMFSDNGKWLVQRVIKECEKILKSAANATNGKIGGCKNDI